MARGDVVSDVSAHAARLVPDHVDRRLALVAAAILVAVTAVAAAIVAAAAAESVRDELRFGFGGVPDRLGEAISILTTNLRILSALLAAAVIAELTRSPRRLARAGQRVMDVLVAAAVVMNAALVGAAIGAYGGRMVAALLPHGPFELAAYALALGLFLRARTGALPAATLLRAGGWAAALLVVAALLETYG
jgi:hypothetical protein